ICSPLASSAPRDRPDNEKPQPFDHEEISMRKRLLAAAFLLVGTTGAHAADLTIPAGQAYTITPELSDLRLEKLSIGDGAQVRFAPGVSRWRVEARHVSDGENVVIDGRGSDGAAGADGAGFADRAKDCEAGANGRNGGMGGTGGAGTSLVLWGGIDNWGIAEIGRANTWTPVTRKSRMQPSA